MKEGVSPAARELGLEPALLYAWRAKIRLQGQDAEAQCLQHAETARLKRGLACLEEENPFLKKAAAYFVAYCAKQPK